MYFVFVCVWVGCYCCSKNRNTLYSEWKQSQGTFSSPISQFIHVYMKVTKQVSGKSGMSFHHLVISSSALLSISISSMQKLLLLHLLLLMLLVFLFIFFTVENHQLYFAFGIKSIQNFVSAHHRSSSERAAKTTQYSYSCTSSSSSHRTALTVNLNNARRCLRPKW